MEATIQMPVYPAGSSKWILVITAISCAILELIDTTIVNVSLQEISGNIGATTVEIAWVITAYSIANVAIIPLSGMLSNLFGRKLYFTTSVLIFTFASLMCGLSGSLWVLVFWRFIQGLGGGGLLSTAMSIILGAFPPEKRMTGLMIYGMGVIVGPSFGPVMGGYITDNFSWHWIFFVNIPFGILASFLSWKFVINLVGVVKPKIDTWGILFLVIGIGSLQYVLEEGTAKDWFDSNEITLFFSISITAIAAFVIRELNIDYPAVNLRLYRSFNMVMGSLLNFCAGIIMIGSLFIFPLFTQVSMGWTATQTGAFMIPGSLVVIVGMVIGKKVLAKGLNPKILILSGVTLNFIFLVLLSFSSPDSNSSNFFWPFIIRGIGTIWIVMPILDLAVAGLSPADMAQSVGLINMFRQLGGAIGVALINVFLSHENVYIRSNMIGHINENSVATAEHLSAFTQNFITAGYDAEEAAAAASKLMDSALSKQQQLVSYDHGFLFVAMLLLFFVPLVLMIRYKKSDQPKKPLADTH